MHSGTLRNLSALTSEGPMLRRASYAWTAQDEAKLKAMVEAGAFLRNIAIRLRRSESSVSKHARELGVKVKRRPRFHFDSSPR